MKTRKKEKQIAEKILTKVMDTVIIGKQMKNS